LVIWRLLVLSALAAVGANPTVMPARAQSGGSPVPIVVELFTSEGCSSCPPADQLLADLVKTQPVPGALVIGLSEHVDYWDNLGWKDPFSSAAFTRRQSGYATLAGHADVYTPQMVINGGEAVVGSDRAAALAAIGRAAAKPAPVTIALTWKDTGHVETVIGAHPASSVEQVYLAVTEDGLASSVKSGENAGHTLDHTGVTRRLIRLGALKADGSLHDVRQIEFDPTWHRPQLHLIAFIQRGESGAIVASRMGINTHGGPAAAARSTHSAADRR
jgi:hypothetical protein